MLLFWNLTQIRKKDTTHRNQPLGRHVAIAFIYIIEAFEIIGHLRVIILRMYLVQHIFAKKNSINW